MKFQISSMIVLVLLVQESHGVTFATIRNFTSLTDGFPILGEDAELVSGSYAVGIYDEDFNFGQPGTLIRAGLTQFGDELTTFGFPGLIGNPNSTSGSVTFENGGQFLNRNVYVLFGNGPTLDDSELFGVFRLNVRFEEENELGLGALTGSVVPGNGELLYGNFASPSSQPVAAPELNVEFNFNQGIQLVNVPEPSTGLLLSVVGFLFLFSRRR